MRSQPPYKKRQSVYWIAAEYIGLSDSDILPLEASLIKEGLKYRPPMRGGDAGAVKEIEVILISLHQHWVDLFYGVLANRIDRLISISVKWFSKQTKLQINKSEVYVMELYLYKKRIFSGEKLVHLKLPLDKPLSKKDIQRMLKSKK